MISTRCILTLALASSAWLYLTPARSQTPPKPVKVPPTTVDVTSTAPPGIKVDFSRESSVIEHMDTVYHYAADGTGSKEITAVIHLQDESAIKAWSVLSFAFASSAEHIEIDYVRVRRPDGAVVETPAADAQEMPAPITREAPFYSDLKEKQVPVRSLRAGDRLEYKLRIIRTRPEAPGHFWGQEIFYTPVFGAVVLEQSVEIHLPKTAYIQVWSPQYKSALTETATEKVYSWHAAQLQPIAGLDKDALKKFQVGEFDDDFVKLPSIVWTNFHDWAEVGAWYREMEGTRITPDADVKAKVAELIAGKQTGEEKIRAIYGYVGPQVRYIGVAFGVGRYQPHDAGDVLRNQYGDCKDKHTLLAAMLSAAGFTADAALVGSGVHFNEAVPSPGSFNHVITVVQLDGKPIWLDATAEVAPYRMLTSTIRGKHALVIAPTGPATIEITPKELPFKPEVHFDADGSLDDKGTSHSHIVMVMRGDEEILFRAAARTISPAQYDELMQRISQGMGYGGTVTHAEFSRPDDTADPLRITYDYEREKGGDWDNLRIYSQILPVALGTIDEKDLPVSPIQLGSPHAEIDHAVMKLPAGWSADLPPAIHAKSDFATLDKTYKLQDGKLITDRRIEILKDKIPAVEWRAYKDWFTAAGLDNEPFIQLNRSGGNHAAGVNDPRAADLINEAQRLEQEHDYTTARKKVDEAKAINPSQAYLWSHYGFLALMYGMPVEATEDFKRELAGHPDEENVSILLARSQLQQGKQDDALATMKELAVRSPSNLQNNQLLVTLLLSRKEYTAAEKVLNNSLAANPGNPATQMMLSNTLLHDGKKDEAKPLLEALAEKSTDPAMLNDSAYALADANLDLPLAEKASRQSLALIEDQAAAASEGESDRASLGRTEMLLSGWDTLAWILFREGKIAEAEPFARAAWSNGLSAESGYHLGMILEKLGQPEKAMAVYQIALFGDKGDNSDIVANNNLDRQNALRKAGTQKQVADGKIALQNQRTIKLPRGSNREEGLAAVQFELSAQGDPKARIVEGERKLAPLLESLQHVDLKASIPADAHIRVIRRGILSCHSGDTCEFVFSTSRDALLHK
jgi:tetratricopeptide (TPR) repeat protein